MNPRLVRLAWPLLVAAVLGAGVIVTLAERVPNVVDVEMGSRDPEWAFGPVALEYKRSPAGITTVGAALWLQRIDRLAGHTELWLSIDAYENTLTVLSGEVHLVGTMCAYTLEAGQTITGRRFVVFRQTEQCYPPLTGQPTGQLNLEITVRGGNKVGLLVSRAPAGTPDPDWITFDRPPRRSPQDPIGVVWARSADTYVHNERRRVELLAYLWQLPGSTKSLWALVLVAVVLVLAGSGLLFARRDAGDQGAWLRAALGAASGVASIALGLSILYAVLVPPLQAPDEPAHFLAFAEVLDRPALREQMLDLARLGHADRLTFRTDERIRPFDVGRPAATAGEAETIPTPPTASESVTTWMWWRALGLVTPKAGAAATLLWLRLANGVIFAASLGLAALLLLFVGRGTVVAPHLAALVLLLVPTLPFFGMHAAEYAVVTSLYVFVAALSAGLWFDTPRSHWLGLPMGIGLALLMGTRRGALPLLPVFEALLLGRALLGSSEDQSSGGQRRSAVIFWAGLTVGLVLSPLMNTNQFLASLWPPDTASQRPDWFKFVAEAPRRFPWLLVLAAPAGLVIELIANRVRRAIGSTGRFAKMFTRGFAFVVAAGVVLSLALSLWFAFPELGGIDGQIGLRPWRYARQVLIVVATSLRLRGHDLWMSSSFWAGFGWLDAIPGGPFVSAMVLLAAIGIIATMLRLALRSDGRGAVRLIVLVVGWVVSLLAYAVSVNSLHRILHGRYVIGLYLVGLVACWTVVALLPRLKSSNRVLRLAILREHVLLLLIAGIHGYSLCYILSRYF